MSDAVNALRNNILAERARERQHRADTVRRIRKMAALEHSDARMLPPPIPLSAARPTSTRRSNTPPTAVVVVNRQANGPSGHGVAPPPCGILKKFVRQRNTTRRVRFAELPHVIQFGNTILKDEDDCLDDEAVTMLRLPSEAVYRQAVSDEWIGDSECFNEVFGLREPHAPATQTAKDTPHKPTPPTIHKRPSITSHRHQQHSNPVPNIGQPAVPEAGTPHHLPSSWDGCKYVQRTNTITVHYAQTPEWGSDSESFNREWGLTPPRHPERSASSSMPNIGPILPRPSRSSSADVAPTPVERSDPPLLGAAVGLLPIRRSTNAEFSRRGPQRRRMSLSER